MLRDAKIIIFWILLLNFNVCRSNEDGSAVKRENTAKEMKVNRFPYVCSLRDRGSQTHVCSGTLIDKAWILTAAHCLESDEDALSYYPMVQCEIYDNEDSDTDLMYSAIDSHTHEKWTGDVNNGFDIAMIQLSREVDVLVPRLDKKGVPPEVDLVALGLGSAEFETSSETLHKIFRLTNAPLDECNDVFDAELKEHTVCARPVSQDDCLGDVGGPLLVADAPDNKLAKGDPSLDLIVGVSTAGRRKKNGSYVCDIKTPGLHSGAASSFDWISAVIKGKAKDPERTERRKAAITEIKNIYKNLSTNKLLFEMIQAIQRDDPIQAKALLLAGVGVKDVYFNSSMKNYPLEKGSSLLHWSAAFDALECVKVLVKQEAKIDAVNKASVTPLYVASWEGSERTVEFLLASGADVNKREKEELTPLHAVCEKGYTNIAKLLVAEGAEVNAKNNEGTTPLNSAVYDGYIEIVGLLIAEGADVTASGESGWSPLHTASLVGHKKIAKLLIEAGAKAGSADNGGWTALHTATRQGHLEIVELLIANGAKADVADDGGWTPLHIAAMNGLLEIAELLISEGADARASDQSGWTPLHSAATNGRLAMAKLLIANGAQAGEGDENGWTPLHVASAQGQFELAELLITNGAETDVADENGWTPLHSAVSNGNLEIVELVIANGALATATDNNGTTPLHTAAANGRLEIAKLLIKEGAKIDAVNAGGQTPLYAAAKFGYLRIAKLLVRKGADVNTADTNGWTPLHQASKHGHPEIAKFFMTKGAELNANDVKGRNPFSVVCKYYKSRCTEESRQSLKDLLTASD